MFKALTTVSLTKIVTSATLAVSGFLSFGVIPAHSFQVFFGEDLNSSATVPLSSFPNSSNEESRFLSNLVGIGTEDFESFATGTGTPLNLMFPGSTGNIMATLSNGGGGIVSVPAGSTNGNGRYGSSPTKYFEVVAGGANNFQVDFDTPVAAFGFFGIDIGDFGGQLQLRLSNGTVQTLTIPNTIGSSGSTDGSVLFYGVIAQDPSEIFETVEFLTSTGQGDVFAFDDFTIAEIDQINPTTPEPSMILGLLAVGGLGLGLKHKKQS